MDEAEPPIIRRRSSSVASSHDENRQNNIVTADRNPSNNLNDVQHPQHSLPVRAIWFIIGVISFVLGGIGIILPGLPTTPFILLSTFAFLQSSDRFYNLLIHSKLFGPIILQWRDHRALPSKRVKVVALLFTICCFSASAIYFVVFTIHWWASLILGVLCMVVCIFLLRIPVVAIPNSQNG